MPLTAVIGHAQALEGREAIAQATHRALDQLGRSPAVLGLIISSFYYPIQQILSGASALLGDVPLLGFSSNTELSNAGPMQRSAIVALLAGEEISVRADYYPAFGEDSRGAAQNLAQAFQLYHARGTLLAIADGFTGDSKHLCAALPVGKYNLAGCLAGGSLHHGRTYQIGGRQSGNGGLAAALISGKLAIGVGSAHGWQPTGLYAQVTRSNGPWVRGLDNRTAAETYAELFQYPVRDWLHPPLNELVRLYPLGLEQKDSTHLLRSPLRMEADGSLRMHTLIPEGATVHFMTGSSQHCLEAARQATSRALQAIGEARPVLALVLTDASWQMMFEAQPGRELQVVREMLGANLPVLSGYTYGQFAHLAPNSQPELLNQHMQVILFAEAKA